jgi:hypothetical protein
MSAPATRLCPVQALNDAHSQLDGAKTLREIVRAHLATSTEPDPHAIAAVIAAALPEAQVREALREGVLCIVTEIIRGQRSRAPHKPDAGAPTSAKWDNVREAVADNPDIFQRRYKTADGWKFLGDFTKADALWNRDEHAKLAAAVTQRATAFELLAKRLRPRGLVRDQLKAEQVEEIFSA